MCNLPVKGQLFTAGSVVLGLFLAGHLTGPSNSSAQQLDVVDPVEVTHLIQEPTTHRAFRPSLSSRSIRRANTRSNFLVLRAFQQAVGNSWKSSVQVFSGGTQVALGAIVGQEGWIVTKASELGQGNLSCRLFDGREFSAEQVAETGENDLALLRINATDLDPVQWETSLPERGSWLATVDLKTTPRSVGVVSSGVQRVQAESAVLGVNLTDSPSGAKVFHVLTGTGAAQAGLRIGDSIFEVNGREVYTTQAFRDAIASARGGEFVKLKVARRDSDTRQDRTLLVQARLMDLTEELLDDTEMEVNGRVSARATGFPKVFLHDTVLEPEQCGGPVVNLDGRVVGLNIARAGRVTSYALPAVIAKPTVEHMIRSAKLVSVSAGAKNDVR